MIAKFPSYCSSAFSAEEAKIWTVSDPKGTRDRISTAHSRRDQAADSAVADSGAAKQECSPCVTTHWLEVERLVRDQ